jgi:hypothetical protein
MNIDLSTLLTIVISVVGNLIVAGGLITTIIQIRRSDAADREKEVERMTRIEVHVETLWDFHIRRSMVEATSKGIGSLNSPFVLNGDKAHDIGGGLKEDLLAWYETLETKDSMNDRDLFIAVEGAFGERLIREMCIPHNIQEGTCVLIAIALIKGENKLEFPSAVTPRT